MTSHTYTMQLTAVVLTAGLCASACVANGAVAEPGHAARIFDVRDFGACGDGVAKDTAAIQKAIDAAAERGGTVRLGAGTYLSGSLYLKSNVEFFLDRGSTLKGSPDKNDYNAVDVCPQNSASKNESASGAHLLLCIEQTNVTVRGIGRIYGNSGAFIIGPDGRNWPGGQSGVPWRPSQMVYFVECSGVRIEGVSLIDSPYWSCFLHGCENVTVRNLLIRTRRELVHTHNGDGLDIDCCENVEVSGCDIDTADDSITLRANSTRLKTKRPCRNIRISDCRLSSACNAVRVGVGCNVVRDAVLRNLTVHDTRTAINFVSGWGAKNPGASFENVVFDGMTVDCRMFCRIYPNSSSAAFFRGIRIANAKGASIEPSWVTGRKSRPIEDVAFENVDVPNGVIVHNANVVIRGGAFKRIDPTPEAAARYDAEIDARGRFPGRLKPGGATMRGNTAFGGRVKKPIRGICAHQGDVENFPGNTAESIAAAVRKGAAMVEFDVQRCRSREFVVMHDGTVDRTTTGKGRVKDLTLAELKELTFKKRPELGCRIPTLDEVIDVVPDGGVLMNVHCYTDAKGIAEIASLLKERGRIHQSIICAGLKGCDAARKVVPEIETNDIQRPGPRSRDWTDAENAKFISEAKAHGCNYLQLSRPWPQAYSVIAHDAGIKVILFKSDDPREVEGLAAGRGIDFIMTNRLSAMNDAFAALGLPKYDDTEGKEGK